MEPGQNQKEGSYKRGNRGNRGKKRYRDGFRGAQNYYYNSN